MKINVESLREYKSKISEDSLLELAYRIYMITDFIRSDYPKHREWFFCKQLPRTINGSKRDILFVRSPDDENEIIAMACLKKTEKEKKICTLFVSKEYRGKGIGTLVVSKAFEWLETNKPLVHFPETNLSSLMPFIKRYDWVLNDEIDDLYETGKKELFFNGTYSKDNSFKPRIFKLENRGHLVQKKGK